MRGAWAVVVAALSLALAAPAAGGAIGAFEPVTGGLTSVPGSEYPGPAPTGAVAPPAEADAPATPAGPAAPAASGAVAPPAPGTALPYGALEPVPPAAAREAEPPSWGLVVRGGYFGLPDLIADKLFRQHPKVSGHTYGAEVRRNGEEGRRAATGVGLAVDAATTSGDGIWQPDERDRPEAFGGEISMLAVTVTWYASLFPSWYVHPYVGFGLGLAHFEGEYQKEDETATVDAWIPVLHVPAGLAFELGERLQLSLEARFLDGIAAGGALQARF